MPRSADCSPARSETLKLKQTRKELERFLDSHPLIPGRGCGPTEPLETGAFVGRCGLLTGEIEGRQEVEVAYLLDKAWWGQTWRARQLAPSRPRLGRVEAVAAVQLDRSGKPCLSTSDPAYRNGPGLGVPTDGA